VGNLKDFLDQKPKIRGWIKNYFKKSKKL